MGFIRAAADTLLHAAQALTDAAFPDVCEVCGRTLARGENVMCGACRRSLPRVSRSGDDTPAHRRLICSAPVERAASYFRYYRGEAHTALILNAKYHNRPRIMSVLGEEFARELALTGFFRGIDVILPVPMHVLKRLRRGFNQTDYLARGVSRASGIPVGCNLVTRRTHRSQTRSGGSAGRAANVDRIYGLRRPSQLDGCHVLIVDDVITTGATLRSIIDMLHSALPSVRVSVLSLGLVPDV